MDIFGEKESLELRWIGEYLTVFILGKADLSLQVVVRFETDVQLKLKLGGLFFQVIHFLGFMENVIHFIHGARTY